MKTYSKVSSLANDSIQAKAKSQGNEVSMLQAYKNETSQLQSLEEEELLQGKFETAQLTDDEEELMA